ncbi:MULTISPECIES: hypothetical protein [unclassified Mycoplasma]|uniref:hypothetical protein n=1 Tax=unclassified Mycoplasma TaxID=2683645 RepID=UPI00197C5A38|nr:MULTISPECIES: hypothetical protein [unclassified Mycoplasma]MBN4084125.1 hypothetical protein [Mycoplasma sp. CSL10166]MCU4706567.1 hypothetical protein [Mycoplasma sp. CSL7503-lung]
MENIEKNKILVKFDEIAHQRNFVYSLFGNSLEKAIKDKQLSNPYEIVIDLQSFLKLKTYNSEQISINKKFSADNPLPSFNYFGEKIYLNLLLASNSSELNYKAINKLLNLINKKSDGDQIYDLINSIYSYDPDIWILLYFDYDESLLKIKKITNINPNYYSVHITKSKLKLPFHKGFINIKND